MRFRTVAATDPLYLAKAGGAGPPWATGAAGRGGRIMRRARIAALLAVVVLGTGAARAVDPGSDESTPALGAAEQEAFAKVHWEVDLDRTHDGRQPGGVETAVVPEPGTLALLGTGIAALALRRRMARGR
jgi:hypothetical protein